MNIHIHADAQNTKNILTLIEEQGFSLPCNCHGAHRCNGARYSFDCSLIPKKPMDVSLPDTSDKIQSVSLEKMETSDGTADTLLIDLGTTTIAMAFIDKESGARASVKLPQILKLILVRMSFPEFRLRRMEIFPI